MLKDLALWAGVCALAPATSFAQLTFTNSTPLMSASNSGGCMGVVDMNGDGLDDIAKLDNARTFVVDYQNTDGSFTTVNYGSVSGSGQWGMAIADLDNNGHKDLVSGGSYDGTHYLRISSIGNGTLSTLNGGTIFTQGMSIGDMDNNGRLDVYACHDDGPPSLWFTNASGVPVNNNAYIDWATDCTGTSGDMSGNYGSNFVDFDNDGDLDLYIAHCRQGVNSSTDCRRWNRLFVNDGNNHYEDLAADYGAEIRFQSWTADFGDVDNDGDFDMFLTNHDNTLQLFENDGTGHFAEITAGSGLEFTDFFLQAKFVDFDNDGFIDILVAGGGEYFFKNNGNKTFTRITNLFPANKAMHSFATGDLNNDGFQDVFANYGSSYISVDNANPDRLWMNNGNANHWFSVRLQGTISNRDAVGARVTITGPWGTQIREVRSGESYGMVTSFACSFGLGTYTTIPTVTVRWPSGLVETFNDIAADQTVTVIENTCISPVAAISTVGEPILCGTNDSVELTANEGFTYLWSNGAETQSITVDQPGNYSVTIDDGSGCTGSTSVFVQENPDETPSVNTSGLTTFCEGGEVTLTSSSAAGYTWSNGAQTQSIAVSAPGDYTVTIVGACGDFMSAPVSVSVLDAPDAPIADDVTIPTPGSAQLIAIGDNITWYDAATGGAPVGSGNVFNTPTISGPTTYWVSAATMHGGGQWYGGAADRLQTAAPGAYHNSADNYLYFTATSAFTVQSVKVYANGAGVRTVQLTDRSNGAVLATANINIPDGESRIQLAFAVPGAGDYGLRAATGGNPQLWRDAVGSNPAYPFALGTVGSITSSSVAGANATAYYYFFYDWEIELMGTLCESPRADVEVNVGNVGIAETNANGIQLWPNPVADVLNIRFPATTGKVSVDVIDIAGRTVQSTTASAKAQQAGQMTLGLNDLAPGEYVVRVRNNDGDSMHRVVVR